MDYLRIFLYFISLASFLISGYKGFQSSLGRSLVKNCRFNIYL